MKNQLHRVIITYLLLLVITAIASCTREAATLNPMSVTATGGGGAVGTDNPQIYAVFPGRLTSHTGSPGVMTNIVPGNTTNDITIVFTRVMDNTSVQNAIQIYAGAALLVFPGDYTVSTTNSQSYSIDIAAGLLASTTYRVVINNTAYLSGPDSLTLDFANLNSLYAGNLIPNAAAASVEFQFTTNAAGTPSDVTAPTLSVTNPADTATGVPIRLTGSNGRIEFTFSEPVDPTTVTGTSITLTGATAGNVTGTVGRIDETNLNFFFLPGSELDYEDTYTLTVSVGNAVEDYAGNPMLQDTIWFSTPLYSAVPASINAGSVYVVYDPGNPTQVTIHWTTDIKSVSHVEIDNAETFAAADNTYHSTALVYNHSYTFTGLARNQVYSFSISTNSDPATLTGGPFNQTLSFNAVIRTTPDASNNYQLAVNGSDETGLKSYQLNVNQSFLIWKRGTGLYTQYMDSSSGTADTWDRWTASGVSLFTAGGLIGIISDGTTTGALVSGVNGGDIYASRIYDSTGIAYTWGSGGLQVYDGSAVNARMALVSSGAVTQLTNGTHTADLEYLYDTTVNMFSGVTNGDYIINDGVAMPIVTVSNKVNNNFMELSLSVFNNTYRSYRIADSVATASGTLSYTDSNLIFRANTFFNIGDVMYNTNSGDTSDNAYIDSRINYAFPPPDYEYTVHRSAVNLSYVHTFAVYPLIITGTADTNILYDNGINFSTIVAGGILANDIVVNLSNGISDKVSSVYSGNEALVLANSSGFVFDSDGVNYQAFRLSDHLTFITSGRSTGIGGSTVTQTGRDFSADGVQAGDRIYRLDNQTYATITATGTDTLTLDVQVFDGANRNFIIYRQYRIVFSWDEGGIIRGKTINYSNGGLIYPDALLTSSFVVTNSGTARNPYIISSSANSAIVVYERDSGGGTWSINAKKIRSDGTFVWADPADQSTDAGFTVSAAFTPAGTYLIKDVISDSNGGCWVLYETNVPSVRVAHISSAGTVTSYSMATSVNAVIASVSATQVMVVYEFGTSPSIIYARRFANTPSADAAVKVSPGAVIYSQLNPRVCGDGSGGAIISWLDMHYFPSVYYSIYAQHLNSSLTQTYSADKFTGIPLLDDQTVSPYLVDHSILRYNDGAGLYEGIHFWTDERGTSKDIYYQNMTN